MAEMDTRRTGAQDDHGSETKASRGIETAVREAETILRTAGETLRVIWQLSRACYTEETDRVLNKLEHRIPPKPSYYWKHGYEMPKENQS